MASWSSRLLSGQAPSYFLASASSWLFRSCVGALGHEVKLVAPQYVKPFVKGNKNDFIYAAADSLMR
ncbi:hypothetical protein PMm318_A49590 [Pseudomonas moorei]|jgi:transposase